MEDLTVACVYRPGNGFTDDYVYRLKAATEKFCAAPHRFVCLTTKKLDGVECVPLKRGLRSWWNKLELFREGLFTGPVVYTDLDMMIVSDVTDIYTYPHEFTAGCNWKYFAEGERVMNSGFMAWDGREDFSFLDQDISGHTNHEYSQEYNRWGDQGWIQDNLKRDFDDIEDLFPGRYVSYKLHVRETKAVPDNASLVAFHGTPRPHEIAWRLPQ